MAGPRFWRAAAAALALCTGCAEQVWNADRWASTHPELAGRSIGRLGDATPYVLVADDSLVFFLCRWSLDTPVRVSLPPDANAPERELLGKGLRAWEDAVAGLHFEVVEAGSAPVRMRFRDTGPEGPRSAVDCEVEPPFSGEGPLRARIVSAQIDLHRAERDRWGRPIDLAANELLGSEVHELGHALGLQGHANGGKTVMVRETDAVRKIGEKLNDEKKPKPLQEPGMQALYSLPSGTLIARRPLTAGAAARVAAIEQRARAQGSDRVQVRVGDRSAAVRWGPGPDLVYYLRDPGKLLEGSLSFEDSLTLP